MRKGRQGGEGDQVRNFPLQAGGHLFDQQVPEGDSPQPGLGVGNSIEDRRIGLIRAEIRRFRIQQPLDIVRDATGQGHLHEYHRLRGHKGMNEGEAGPVRDQPVLQLRPVGNAMHRFIADQVFQQHGGTVPPDAHQAQKAQVEKGFQQAAQFVFQGRQGRIALEKGIQIGAQVDQELDSRWNGVELPEEVMTRAFQCPGQSHQGLGDMGFRRAGARIVISGIPRGPIGGDGPIERLGVHGKVLVEHFEEAPAFVLRQLGIGVGHLRHGHQSGQFSVLFHRLQAFRPNFFQGRTGARGSIRRGILSPEFQHAGDTAHEAANIQTPQSPSPA